MSYAENARRYFDAGIAAVPLVPREKRPCIVKWSDFCKTLPTEAQHQGWQDRYWEDGHHGIGIAAGPASNVCFIDVDTVIDSELKAIESLLPKSPFVKIGKKGFTAAYRFHGGGCRAFKLKDKAGRTIVECLSSGNQTVVEGIHPETGLEYKSNVKLYDVIGQLTPLPNDFEKTLRQSLKDLGLDISIHGDSRLTEFTPTGSRDNRMIHTAGLFAREVLRGRLTLVDAIGQMRAWGEEFVQHVKGDPLDVNKGITRIIEYINKDLSRNNKLVQGWDKGLSEEERTKLGIVWGEDNEVWTGDRIQKHLIPFMQAGIEDLAHEPEMISEVNRMLVKIAEGYRGDPLYEEIILKWMVTHSGKKYTYGALKRTVNGIRNDSIGGKSHNEIAMAALERLERDGGDVTYWLGCLRQWNGDFWEVLADTTATALVASEFGDLPAAKKAGDHKGIVTTMKGARPRLAFPRGDEAGVNFANGYLKSNGELVPHDKDFGMTYVMPFRYLPEKAKECPKWLAFLDSVWRNDSDKVEKKAALQEAICVSMMGMATRFQRAILLYGVAGSGKSQLLKVVEGLFPPEVITTTPPTMWGDKFSKTRLSTSLLNLCGDLEENKSIPAATFKNIIVGDPEDGQYKGKDLFTFKSKAAHWFGSNHLPKSRDVTEGFNRRWLSFSFNRVVESSERVLDFGDVLIIEEREAIAAWVMQAIPRISTKTDYTIPPSHQDNVNRMAEDNSNVLFFIRRSGKVTVSDGYPPVEVSRLYNEFLCYQISGGGNVKSIYTPVRFQNELLGIQGRSGLKVVMTNGQALVRGLKLNS